jgi:hypothetical protein
LKLTVHLPVDGAYQTCRVSTAGASPGADAMWIAVRSSAICAARLWQRHQPLHLAASSMPPLHAARPMPDRPICRVASGETSTSYRNGSAIIGLRSCSLRDRR